MACTTLPFCRRDIRVSCPASRKKSLKAWMCALGLTYPFTHHINRLLVLLQDAGAEVEAFWWTDEFALYAQ
jgi:HEPN domain-containing protein